MCAVYYAHAQSRECIRKANMTSSLLIASLVLLFTMLLRCSIRVTALTLVSQNSTISGSAGKCVHENISDYYASCWPLK